jgi:hypothetical protein
LVELLHVEPIGDAGMTDDYEQPVTLARIAFLAAVALPVLGGLYYALLLQRRWTAAGPRMPLALGERVRLNSGSPIGLVVDTGEQVTIAWPAGEATFPQESLYRV